MLGLLRDDGESPTPAPLPGLSDRDKLIEQARANGLTVEEEVEGDARPLPRGLDLTAYRILQEALTNARKHAGHVRARVWIRYGTGALEIEVYNYNAPEAKSVPGIGGGGHGLIGMRERVALYGGQLEAGPDAKGGFRVKAHLPLDLEAQ